MIDFRSDTVTRPTPEMREAMASAEVGDDVYGDDPTVNSLQAFAAERLGFESALFTATGTQANLLAIMSHCGRGDEYLCGQSAHNYRYEGGGAAVLGSVQPQPIENEGDGSINLEKARAAQLRDYLADQSILITAGNPIRFVTHLDVNRQDVDRLLDAIRRFYQS
jgi:threonine aldolase